MRWLDVAVIAVVAVVEAAVVAETQYMTGGSGEPPFPGNGLDTYGLNRGCVVVAIVAVVAVVAVVEAIAVVAVVTVIAAPKHNGPSHVNIL